MSRYRFGLVGCGRISSKHIDALQSIEEAELVAVCDTNAARAAKVAADNRTDQVFDDINWSPGMRRVWPPKTWSTWRGSGAGRTTSL